MKKTFWVLILFSSVLSAQVKERIPYSSYDFLKLVNKYYKDVPLFEEAEKSTDAEGVDCYVYVSDGKRYLLYPDNVLKITFDGGKRDFYLVDGRVCCLRVVKDKKGKWLSFYVNGKTSENFVG